MTNGEKGALIGGFVAFALGVAFAASNRGETRVTFGTALTFGFILAIPGAVIGGLVGNASGRR